MGKRRKTIEADASPLTSNPFASLAPLMPDLPPGEAVKVEPDAGVTSESGEASTTLELRGRLVVRRQKKGQGGKTATYIEGLDPAQIPLLLPMLKRLLGCSGRVDGPNLVLGTGDHERVSSWLRDQGATKVVLGN